MDDQAFKKIEFTVKVFGVLAVIIGGAVGLWKYFDAAEKDFRKPYWERQIALYFEATAATGTIASVSEGAERDAAEARFWQLYYGPLALVEDLQVEAAMVQFRNCLLADCTQRDLQRASLALAHACRESLGDSWSLQLAELQGRYNR